MDTNDNINNKHSNIIVQDEEVNSNIDSETDNEFDYNQTNNNNKHNNNNEIVYEFNVPHKHRKIMGFNLKILKKKRKKINENNNGKKM